MSVDFAELLYRSLPGLYRDKDEQGELRRFLEIVAAPLSELEASVAALHQDYFIEHCRDPFIPLLGQLVGVEVDPTLPARAGRLEVREALPFYRSKGLASTLTRLAEAASGSAVTLVDFSAAVAGPPFLDALNPVELRRDQPVGDDPVVNGAGHFRADRAIQPLFDALRGRPIARAALAGNERGFAGVEGRFDLEQRGASLFGGPAPYVAVAADLTDFAQPKAASGAALALTPTQIAIDPELGRFLCADPSLLLANLRGTHAALTPASIPNQALDVRAPRALARLGRIDDRAPYTVDLRAPRRATESVGRKHFDNHGFFVTPGRPFQNQLANVLPPGSESGRFSFDHSPLVLSDSQGVALQLLDAWDGVPITRRALEGRELDFCGKPRGFTIRVAGISLTDPASPLLTRVRAADLSDFANPKTPSGAPLPLGPDEVAVDPELGRFRLDLASLGVRAEQVSTDYLLALVSRIEGATPVPVDPSVPDCFGFFADAAALPLRDRLDGTPISMAVRLGRSLSEYHGGARGWVIRRDGIDVSSALAAEPRDLSDVTAPVAPGRLAIDVDRARFKFAPGFLSPTAILSVDCSFEDPAVRDSAFESVARRLPRGLPAGVVPVLIDTRRTPVNPAKVN